MGTEVIRVEFRTTLPAFFVGGIILLAVGLTIGADRDVTPVVAIGADPGVTTVIITATGDSAVRTDQSTPEDSPEIEGGNFGDQPAISSGYVYGIVGDERLVSVGLFQFDLTPVLGEELLSVHAQLFVVQTVFNEAVRLVDLHMVVEGEWSEDMVAFTNRPGWTPEPVATAAVYGPGLWYSWDITAPVLQLMESSPVISFATGLRTTVVGAQEEVIFAAKEAATEVGTRQPRLMITIAGKDTGTAQ